MQKKISGFFFCVVLVISLLFNIFVPMSRGSPAYEDFTSFIETDTGNDRIQVQNSTWVDHRATRNEDTYLYKNYTTDYFTDYTMILDTRTGFDQNSFVGYVWMTSNNIDDFYGHDANNYTAIGIRLQRRSASPVRFMRIQEIYNQIYISDDSVTLTDDTWYYLKIVKDGTSFVVGLYSTDALRDSGDGTDGDVDNLAITLSVDHSFAILYACNTYNDGAGVKYGDDDIANLEIQVVHSITFRFNEGGILRVNNQTMINGTQVNMSEGVIIELAGIPQNSSYYFRNFTWPGGGVDSNPYNYTITGTATIWCNFLETPPITGPISRFNFYPSNPSPNQNVTFNGSMSVVFDGNITNYFWTLNSPFYGWDLLNQEWQSVVGWTKEGGGISEISPMGQLWQKANHTVDPYVGRSHTISEGLPSEYSIEIRLNVTNWGSWYRYSFYDGVHYVDVKIDLTAVSIQINSTHSQSLSLLSYTNTWYNWVFVVNSTSELVMVYRDNTYIGNVTSLPDDSSNDGFVRTRATKDPPLEFGEAHEDYIRIGSGLYVPPFGTLLGNTSIMNYTFSEEGNYTVFLSVVDNKNLRDYFTQTVTVEIAGSVDPPGLRIAFMMAGSLGGLILGMTLLAYPYIRKKRENVDSVL